MVYIFSICFKTSQYTEISAVFLRVSLYPLIINDAEMCHSQSRVYISANVSVFSALWLNIPYSYTAALYLADIDKHGGIQSIRVRFFITSHCDDCNMLFLFYAYYSVPFTIKLAVQWSFSFPLSSSVLPVYQLYAIHSHSIIDTMGLMISRPLLRTMKRPLMPSLAR